MCRGISFAAQRGPVVTPILVVDDDQAIVRMLERTFAAKGYDVISARDGGGALAALERSAPELVILDVAMPGIDGIAVCRRIRARGLALPILLLTARDAVADRVAGLDAGADDYLVKPSRRRLHTSAVKRWSLRLRATARSARSSRRGRSALAAASCPSSRTQAKATSNRRGRRRYRALSIPPSPDRVFAPRERK